MNLLDRAIGFFQPAEPPYAPLGFAPYQKQEGSFFSRVNQSEFDKSIEAIDKSLDRRADLPEHVRHIGKIALYSELTKQAGRNMILDTAGLPQKALEGLMPPDQLVDLMDETEYMRAIELARRTHVGIRDVHDQINNPVEKLLLASTDIDTVISKTRRSFKKEFISPELITVAVKQKRLEHVQGNIVTVCRQLFILDLLNPDNPLSENADVSLRRTIVPHIDKNADYPEWLVPAITTYYAYHPSRLDALKQGYDFDKNKELAEKQWRQHIDTSPNLPVWHYSSESPRS